DVLHPDIGRATAAILPRDPHAAASVRCETRGELITGCVANREAALRPRRRDRAPRVEPLDVQVGGCAGATIEPRHERAVRAIRAPDRVPLIERPSTERDFSG